MLYDVSMMLDENLIIYPGDEGFVQNWYHRFESGIDYSLSSVSMSVHNGTHMDAPYHFCKQGLKIDEIPLELLVGKVLMLDLGDKDVIEAEDIPVHIETERIFLKTNKKLKPDHPDNPHLSLQATVALIEKGIKLIGINQMSIDKIDSEKYPVHKLLTRNNIAIIENLELSSIEEGYYRLICAPLKIAGSEAAPCRVYLETI